MALFPFQVEQYPRKNHRRVLFYLAGEQDQVGNSVVSARVFEIHYDIFRPAHKLCHFFLGQIGVLALAPND